MAKQVLSVGYRINVPYTVIGITHVARVFLEVLADGTKPSGYHVVDRDGAWPDVGDVANDFVSLLAACYKSDVSFANAVLEKRFSGEWHPVISLSTAMVGANAAASTEKAGSLTFTWRSTDYDLMKFIMLESIFESPFKTASPDSISTAAGDIDRHVRLGKTTATTYGPWIRSRSGELATSFVRLTSTLNRTTRKQRGLA